jgi:phosphate transport system substrate-binding protein
MWEPGAQGQVTNWKQIRPGFPDAPLRLFGPGADSGTFDFFTEAVVGKAKASRGDYTASEDDNILVQGVAKDKNALGYFGFAYYDQNKGKLKAVAISREVGQGVFPSQETVIDGQYPLSRPLFIYVSKKSLEKPGVKEFVEFYLKNAARLAKEVKYVPLPAEAYTSAIERFQAGKTGTVFGGKPEVGLTIQKLLEMELKE